MDRNPQVEKAGKILRLLRPRRPRKAPDGAKVIEARVMESRRRRALTWISGAWVLLAWIVAACRLRSPVMHHEVFGAEAGMAFLVVVVLPLMQAGRIADAAREAVIAL